MIPVGSRVRVRDSIRRFGGREGRVLSSSFGELGVAFGKTARVNAWFLERELTLYEPKVKLKVSFKVKLGTL